MNRQSPRGWEKTKLGDVAAVIMGQSPPSVTYNISGEGLPFFQGKAEFGKIYPTPIKFCSAPSKVAQPDDILISVRAPVGPTNLCREKSCIGRGLAAIRPYQGVSSRYLFYFLRSREAWLSAQGSGSTFAAISRTDLEPLSVPLAPLNEQSRIVARLEELTDIVDACQKRLGQVPRLLKQFRQSVLAAASSGKLTANWRTSGFDETASGLRGTRQIEGRFFNSEISDDIPRSWCRTTIDAFLSKERIGMKTGPFGLMLRKSEHQTDGIPVLGIENIGYMQFIKGSKIHITAKKAKELMDYEALPGDVLISRSGTVGEVCVVPDDIGQALISTNLIRVALSGEVIVPMFFCFLFNGSPFILEQVREFCKGSTRLFLNQTILKAIIFPLPPIKEQIEIVRRVEALFKIADALEDRYRQAQEQLDKLPQSILAKAFRGELIPQDPDDEPASALLERIKADMQQAKPDLLLSQTTD